MHVPKTLKLIVTLGGVLAAVSCTSISTARAQNEKSRGSNNGRDLRTAKTPAGKEGRGAGVFRNR